MIKRYDFENDISSTQPQLLYFIKDECYYEYDKTKTLTHNIAELCYITSGKGYLHVENEEFSFTDNCMYVINPYVAHGEFLKKREEGFSYYILGISNFLLSPDRKTYKPLSLNSQNTIIKILDLIYNEQENRNTNYKTYTSYLFKLLMIEIERLYSTTIENSSQLNESMSTKIKNFIDINYLGDCSAKTVVDFFNVKLNTAEKKFKKKYGISMQGYILKLRIEQAKKSLEFDKVSIRDIALAFGFYNPSYFAQYFKKIVGISPSEYRKNIQSKLSPKSTNE